MVLSDSIVLWRMYVVWDRARPVLVLGAAFLLAILGLNIANITEDARVQLVAYTAGIAENKHDTEIISIYGASLLGLLTAFVSLACNLCATTLVGVRVWYASNHTAFIYAHTVAGYMGSSTRSNCTLVVATL